MEIIQYINIFQTCLVEIIENVVLPRNMLLYLDTKIDFPVIRSTHKYWETSQETLNPSVKWFHMYCGTKVAISLDPSGYQFNATTTPIKTHLLHCEATFYITPFTTCQKWCIGITKNFKKTTSSSLKNRVTKLIHEEEGASVIYRSGQYYITVGSSATMTQPMQGNIYYEIDVPKYSLTAPARFSLHTKFYLEISTSGQSFYFVEAGNIAEAISRVNKLCTSNDKSSGYMRYLTLYCVYNTFTESKYIFHKLDSIISEKNVLKTMSLRKANIGKLHWVLICPSCKVQSYEIEGPKQPYRLTNWKGFPSVEHIIINQMFKNSTIIIDIRYSNKQLPLPQIYVEQNINGIQFVRIENNGYHFVTCSNILKGNGLNFIGLVNSFDLFTWLALLAMSALSTIVLIYLLQHSNVKYDVYDVCSLTTKILLEQNTPKYMGISCNILCVWFLVGVIISQCYKGDNITQLTAPFKKPKLEHYKQLLDRNFSFLSHISFHSILKDGEDAVNLLAKLSSVFSVFLPGNFENNYMKAFLSQFETTYVNSVTSEQSSLVDKIHTNLLRPQLIANLTQTIDLNYFVDTIQTCGRQAYIGSYENAFSIYTQLRDKLEAKSSDFVDSLSLSKETLAPTVTTWRFAKFPVDSDQLIIRVHSFLQSGIMDLWSRWNLRIQTYNDMVLVAKRSKSPVKSLSIHDNVSVIFYLWLSLLCLDCIVFGKEISMHLLKKIWSSRVIRNVINKVINLL